MQQIPFNKPFLTGREGEYLSDCIKRNAIASDGYYTKWCAEFLQSTFLIKKVLMTPSCTAALELAALLCDVGPGDEVILPSYTFVSTANAFVLRGATPVFVDIRPDTLNIDEKLIENAITPRTKVICPVHYAGVACEMDEIMRIAKKHNLIVIEDAAQAVNSYYKGKALGSIGHLGAYSFHETKNYVCGEGGAISINDDRFIERAEILREKGTNRSQFLRGIVDKYTWVDVGASYLPSELASSFLRAQFESLDQIKHERKRVFEAYESGLEPLLQQGSIRGPRIPRNCDSNYHMYYVLLESNVLRDGLMTYLRSKGISAVFHYVPLHSSPKGKSCSVVKGEIVHTDLLSSRLLRLPMYASLSDSECHEISKEIIGFLS